MDIYRQVEVLFWHEELWLPINVTWKDLANRNDGIYHPQVTDLHSAVLIGLLLVFSLPIFERFVARRIGLLYIEETSYPKAPHNEALENVYSKNKKTSNSLIQVLVKQTDLTERQIERWFRIRRRQDKPSKLEKFTKGSGKFTIHLLLQVMGTTVLWNAPWVWDSDEYWRNYPHQNVSSGVYWYYMAEFGFYISELTGHLTYDRKKDFWPMFIHHIITVILLAVSWCVNFVRIGSMVLLVHDCVEPLIELTKLCIYTKRWKVCVVSMCLMTVTWVVTRLLIFPYKCIWCVWTTHLQASFKWPLYFTSFVGLYILHCIWTVFMIKFITSVLTAPVWQDSRSSEEEEDSDECQLQTHDNKANS